MTTVYHLHLSSDQFRTNICAPVNYTKLPQTGNWITLPCESSSACCSLTTCRSWSSTVGSVSAFCHRKCTLRLYYHFWTLFRAARYFKLVRPLFWVGELTTARCTVHTFATVLIWPRPIKRNGRASASLRAIWTCVSWTCGWRRFVCRSSLTGRESARLAWRWSTPCLAWLSSGWCFDSCWSDWRVSDRADSS